MNYTLNLKVNSILLGLLLLFFSGFSFAQTKQVDIADQVENLMKSLDDLSYTQKKIQIIEERIDGVQPDESEQTWIENMLISLNNEKERKQRIIVSTEHYLNSIGAEVEISAEKYQTFTIEVQSLVSSNELYKIIQ